MSRKITTDIWYNGIVDKNKLKYDYSRSVYISAKDELEIICPEHGSFWQSAYIHQKGAGCSKCHQATASHSQRKTQDEFISDAVSVQKDIYDYSKVVYINSTTKVDIVCDKHGVFQMLPLNHLRGQQCPTCAQCDKTNNQMKSQNTFIDQCLKLNNKNLDYSEAVYKGDKVKIKIICTHHGEFYQQAGNHLQGQGCPKCMKCGFNKGKPGYLYIMTNTDITKVGITNRKPKVRQEEVVRSGGPKLDIVASFYFKDGSFVNNLESTIHKYLAQHYKPVDAKFDGSTECFLNVDLQALINFVTPLATVSPSELV